MKKAYDKEIARLGRKIKELRKEHKFTQQTLADLCEIDIRTIQRIETGEYEIGLKVLYAVAKAFEIHITKLLED